MFFPILFVTLGCQTAVRPAADTERTFTLLHQANVQGEIEPCG